MNNLSKIFLSIFFIFNILINISCDRSPIGNEINQPPSIHIDYKLIWSDEFNDSQLNQANWNYDYGYGNWGWGNDEWQNYTNSSDNIKVENGNLIITARCPSNNPGKRDGSITSAKIHSKNKVSFKYGKIQARIKAPRSTGMWPAFWMLGQNIDSVSWPFCGEIDIFEMFVNQHIPGFDEYTTHFNLHWADGSNIRQSYGSHRVLDQMLSDDFHVYEIEWNSTAIIGKIDGIEYFYKEIINPYMTEFHQNFFMIFNIAVGGNPVAAPDHSTDFPQEMRVDWVRWYQKTE